MAESWAEPLLELSKRGDVGAGGSVIGYGSRSFSRLPPGGTGDVGRGYSVGPRLRLPCAIRDARPAFGRARIPDLCPNSDALEITRIDPA